MTKKKDTVKGKKTTRRQHTSNNKAKRKKRNSRLFFRSWPSWWLWAGGIAAAVIYTVVFYHFFVSPYSFRWRAYYSESTFPDGYTIHGIDISHYQGDVEWEKVRNARIGGEPVTFVIIKATEGTTLADEYFQRNFMKARRNDIVRGAYHYFKPEVDALAQARFFIRNVALEPGDLPPILDVEEAGHLTTAELQRRVKLFLGAMERAYGVPPILYTGRSFKTSYLADKSFDRYPLWLAHYYVGEMTYPGPWIMWQHTDAGRVDGIKGKVDCNIFNGSMQDLQALLIPDNEQELSDDEPTKSGNEQKLNTNDE